MNRILSKLARAISKILFILGSYNFLAYLECFRSYAWSKGHSDPDVSSVEGDGIKYRLFSQIFSTLNPYVISVLLSIPFNKLPCAKDIQSPVGGLKMSGWPNSRAMNFKWITIGIWTSLLNKGNWCSRYVIIWDFVISIYFEKDVKFIYFIKMELLYVLWTV